MHHALWERFNMRFSQPTAVMAVLRKNVMSKNSVCSMLCGNGLIYAISTTGAPSDDHEGKKTRIVCVTCFVGKILR